MFHWIKNTQDTLSLWVSFVQVNVKFSHKLNMSSIQVRWQMCRSHRSVYSKCSYSNYWWYTFLLWYDWKSKQTFIIVNTPEISSLTFPQSEWIVYGNLSRISLFRIQRKIPSKYERNQLEIISHAHPPKQQKCGVLFSILSGNSHRREKLWISTHAVEAAVEKGRDSAGCWCTFIISFIISDNGYGLV